MDIIQITRKVTGNNYSNIELTATITKDENPLECAINLDKEAREMLRKIDDTKREELETFNKKARMLDKIDALKRAIEKNEINELPF